ncbi:MAG: CBS domain-containing protein [Planctomycetes bacterium]|nr:CBS domain-containing protein [Planctomycetota bacterium]
MKVSDICSRDIRFCTPDTNLAEAASIMWEQDCGIVPVVDEKKNVKGVVTDRDICMAVATRSLLASQITASQVMNGKSYTCRLNDDLRTAMRTMAENSVRRLLVLNDAGELSGVLSLTDAILASKDSKSARTGDMTWAEVVPIVGAICRPRNTEAKASMGRSPALAGTHA